MTAAEFAANCFAPTPTYDSGSVFAHQDSRQLHTSGELGDQGEPCMA